jgi:hypothetical protein
MCLLAWGIGGDGGGVASAATTKGQPPARGRDTMVIRIGALVDQTGASTSPLFRAAVELAATQMNQALARSGSRLGFEVVFGDTKSSPPQAQAEALRLINQEQVKALVSDSSGDTVAVNKLNYNPAGPAKQKVPITCFQCSSSFINDPNVVEADPLTQAAERDADNWLFRVFYNAKYEAAVQVQIALKNRKRGDGNFKIGIFADAGHRSLATAIAATLPSFSTGPSSTEIIYFSSVANLGADWAKVVDDRNESTGQTDGVPDVVVVAMLPNEATEAIKAYRQAGHTIPIQSNNSFRRNYILAQVGAVANGLEGSSVTLVDKSPSGEAFVKAFKVATGQPPEVTSSGAYDCAATLMLAAMVAAGDARRPHEVTPAAIREGLTKINNPAGQKIRPTVEDFASAIRVIRQGKPINYEGAYNSDDWDAVGDIFPPLVRWKVENQQFVEYELYRCDPEHPRCPVK